MITCGFIDLLTFNLDLLNCVSHLSITDILGSNHVILHFDLDSVVSVYICRLDLACTSQSINLWRLQVNQPTYRLDLVVYKSIIQPTGLALVCKSQSFNIHAWNRLVPPTSNCRLDLACTSQSTFNAVRSLCFLPFPYYFRDKKTLKQLRR